MSSWSKPLDERVQRLLPCQRGHRCDGESHGDLGEAEEHHSAEQEDHDPGHLGRQAVIGRMLAHVFPVAHDDHERDEHARAHEDDGRVEPHRQVRRDGARLGEQQEGPNPAYSQLAAGSFLLLALETDERADEQRDGELGEGMIDHDAS